MRPLTSQECAIIANVHLQGDSSILNLARELKIREHVIRYKIRDLISRQILNRCPVINYSLLGVKEATLFYSYQTLKETKLTSVLSTHPDVVWIMEFAGEFNVGICLRVSDLSQINQFQLWLSQKLRNISNARSISFCLSWTTYRRNYLSEKRSGPSDFSVMESTRDERLTLDDIDKKILMLLCKYPEYSIRKLSSNVGIASSTMDFRIQSLKTRKVLLGWIYRVTSLAYGVYAFRLLLLLKSLNQESIDRISIFAFNHPNIVYMERCLGSWDFEFKVEVEDRRTVLTIQADLGELLGNNLYSIRVLTIISEEMFESFPLVVTN